MGLSFATHLDVLPVDRLGLVALGEHGCDVYAGPEFAKLGSLIDGSREEPEVVASCAEPERPAIAAAIADLRRAGVLMDNGSDRTVRDAAWWSSQRIPAAAAADQIETSSVRVQTTGALD